MHYRSSSMPPITPKGCPFSIFQCLEYTRSNPYLDWVRMTRWTIVMEIKPMANQIGSTYIVHSHPTMDVKISSFHPPMFDQLGSTWKVSIQTLSAQAYLGPQIRPIYLNKLCWLCSLNGQRSYKGSLREYIDGSLSNYWSTSCATTRSAIKVELR